MDRIQSLQKAKFYLEMLSCSFDPTTQEYVDDPLLQKEDVKNMLKYASSVLDELIANDGEVINVDKPLNFQVSKINKQAIVLSDTAIQLSTLMARINRQVDTRSMRKLAPSKISKWLIKQGYLADEKVSVVKEVSQLVATENAENIGIVTDRKVDRSTGEIKPRILLTRKAQEYIVDNLEVILEYEESSQEQDEQQEDADLSRQGLPWPVEEDEALIEEYSQSKLSVKEIARRHNRKQDGIRARLKKLGLYNHI